MRIWLNRVAGFSLAAILAFVSDGGAALAATPMISLGMDHALALRSNGTVVAWGADYDGKLGVGRSLFASTPVQVPGLSGVRAVGSGQYYSLAVRTDGTVWAWGNNRFGALGDGTMTDRASPVQVKEITDAVMVCGGGDHSMAVGQDGTVWSWGDRYLGDGTQIGGSAVPLRVAGLSNVASVSCGFLFSLALLKDGTVWAWGSNANGSLGLGDTVDRLVPVQVPGLANVIAVRAGNGRSAALMQDGTVREWGMDGQGTPILSPVQTAGVTDASGIYGGGILGLAAIKSDGVTLWSWGSGQAPVIQPSVGPLAAVASGSNHTVLLKSDGTALAYGNNDSGQLGTGGLPGFHGAPAQVIGLSNIVALSGGFDHYLALAADGAVWAWGSNSHGQLGLGGSAVSTIPIEVTGLSEIVQVSAGWGHSLALDRTGGVWAWGIGGILGDGTSVSRSTPVRVSALTDVQAVAAGNQYSLALKRDGTVWAWGTNQSGRLGNATSFGEALPVQVAGLSDVIVIAASEHGLAVKRDGTVWGWGANHSGQLGLGTITPSGVYQATQIPGLAGVTSVAVNYGNSYALKTDGTVMAWGSNWSGQIGDGSQVDRLTPVAVIGLTGVAEIAAGGLARKTDGSVWAWGQDVTRVSGPIVTPTKISSISNIQHIAAGAGVNAFVRDDGLVSMAGDNRTGVLGNGTFAGKPYQLVVNPSANGFLSLTPDLAFEVPPALGVPFFVVAKGGITDNSASVSTTTKFKAADLGTSGAVYVTAMVPPGSLVPATSGMSALGRASGGTSAATGASAFVLVNLTSSGWQPVVNGQLLPYASGVLGDQIAAQTIIDGTDTSGLKGAQFCLGYGASADQMIAAGTMRVVATIPDPNALGTTAPSCVIAGPAVSYSLTLPPGWNLIGNSLNQSLTVATLLGDVNSVTSVWKWDANALGWQFYTPQMDSAALQTYATGKGYAVLATINPGEGYWVNIKAQPALGTQSGASIVLTGSNLIKGWNLVATGENLTPGEFNAKLNAAAVPASLTTLWAWDNAKSAWYFYAPSLEAQGGTALSSYLASKGYLDFTTANKKLGNGTGFWVNR